MRSVDIYIELIRAAKEMGAKKVILEGDKLSIEFDAPFQITFPEEIQNPVYPEPTPGGKPGILPGQVVMYGCPTEGPDYTWNKGSE